MTKDIPRRKLDVSQPWLKVILSLDIRHQRHWPLRLTRLGEDNNRTAVRRRVEQSADLCHQLIDVNWWSRREPRSFCDRVANSDWCFNHAADVEIVVWKYINRSITNFTPSLFNYFKIIENTNILVVSLLAVFGCFGFLRRHPHYARLITQSLSCLEIALQGACCGFKSAYTNTNSQNWLPTKRHQSQCFNTTSVESYVHLFTF